MRYSFRKELYSKEALIKAALDDFYLHAGGSIPGTREIPVPQRPQSNSFVMDIPKLSSAVKLAVNPGTTGDPEM